MASASVRPMQEPDWGLERWVECGRKQVADLRNGEAESRHGGRTHSRPPNYGVPPHVRLNCLFLRCADTYPSPPHTRKWRTWPPQHPLPRHPATSSASSPRPSSAPPSTPSSGTTTHPFRTRACGFVSSAASRSAPDQHGYAARSPMTRDPARSWVGRPCSRTGHLLALRGHLHLRHRVEEQAAAVVGAGGAEGGRRPRQGGHGSTGHGVPHGQRSPRDPLVWAKRPPVLFNEVCGQGSRCLDARVRVQPRRCAGDC